jgi:hypothetical protein
MCEIELLLLGQVARTVQAVWRRGTAPVVSRPGDMLDEETTPSSARFRAEMLWLWWRKEAAKESWR